ncbi:MAG: lipocalin-like domain-containing protein [Vampirovibrionales bacterium]
MHNLLKTHALFSLLFHHRLVWVVTFFMVIVTLISPSLHVFAQNPQIPRVATGYSWHFPKDHGLHPNYSTEWWYTTGHLWIRPPKGTSTKEPRRQFGYELTFFKSHPNHTSWFQSLLQNTPWYVSPVYTAHFAVSTLPSNHRHTHASQGGFQFFEQVSRAGTQEAGASQTTLQLWHRAWTLSQKTPTLWHLSTGDPQHAPLPVLNLSLQLQQPPTLQGDASGYSQKTQCQGCGSLYYSIPHITTTGTLTLLEQGKRVTYPVEGLSWFDHEIMQQYQYPTLKGWDWFAIQVPATPHHQRFSLMLYQLRKAPSPSSPSSIEPYSQAALILSDGTKRVGRIGKDVFLTPKTYWHSPKSGGVYPIEWQIQWPQEKLFLNVKAHLMNQEIVTHLIQTPVYWEGACQVLGTRNHTPIKGHAYLEMTGYAAQR